MKDFETFFEDDVCLIQIDPKTKITFSSWKTMPDSQQFRAGLDKMLTAFEAQGDGKLISDTRKLGGIAPEDQEWTLNDWNARAIGVGFRAIGIVMPQDVFAQFSVETVMESAAEREDGVAQQQFFATPEEAHAWLLTV